MSFAGEGAVAIWHDIAPEGREEFYAWHGEEHMPERVGIPGFVRGRRYVATRPCVEFFNLYETLSPQVVQGIDYRARLDSPTPWTRATVTWFRNVSRALCAVAFSTGKGCGGLIGTWRYDVPDEAAEEHRRAMCERLLPALAGRRGVAGAHFLVADPEASATETAERQARGGDTLIPRWIVLLEGWGDEAPFESLCREALSDEVLAGTGMCGAAEFGLYRLQATRLKTHFSAG